MIVGHSAGAWGAPALAGGKAKGVSAIIVFAAAGRGSHADDLPYQVCARRRLSLVDMAICVLIAFRPTCAIGLIAGIVASLSYMLGTAILTLDLWIERLGALVKTGRRSS